MSRSGVKRPFFARDDNLGMAALMVMLSQVFGHEFRHHGRDPLDMMLGLLMILAAALIFHEWLKWRLESEVE